MTWRRIYGPHRSNWCGDDALYEEESVYGWGPLLADPLLAETSWCCEFEFTIAYYVVALDGRAAEASGEEPTQWGVDEAWIATHRDANLDVIDDDYHYPPDGGDIRIFASFEDAKARCKRLAEQDESWKLAWDPTITDQEHG